MLSVLYWRVCSAKAKVAAFVKIAAYCRACDALLSVLYWRVCSAKAKFAALCRASDSGECAAPKPSLRRIAELAALCRASDSGECAAGFIH